ncbi:7-cyano-7-deazaguanine synthase QueC [Helicobacter ailurogastricus]|nr:7-cyano-7-deazaguanine synthase QueC [Helicobacter ailurogastricus]CRF41093.1 Queuosine Biosynthesis QueC ATPase [Helicobacter ailurogastricus]CRF42476.1 Queuosine Biosynthesis QueC ATPase [Helicobacter ailurogastricus]CRF43873.1 Queuosine Biosynthesis QueC ATPase [Helicobacter ailurogastricus]BDQ29764.1 7-cyano-7-deazaguanine synthase [Helicobacter ailurogastricus]GLH58494.1 7-cyano-7-deazaguanine synthase ExsB [Helicobacter ailurogastricus]
MGAILAKENPMILEKTYNASCVLCFSGGQDSTTLALWAKKAFSATHLLAFDYAQKHAIELEQAQKIAGLLNLPLKILDVRFLQEITLSALFANHPQKSHAPHPQNPDLPASFVPDRNALFFTLAHAYAFNLGADFVLVGVSQQDYSGYFDCRAAFLESLQTSLNLGAFGVPEGITFLAPFMQMSKAQEFGLARDLGGLDFVLEYTHTCYEGVRGVRHAYGYGCGVCPACQLRQAAYQEFLEHYKQN